MDPWEHILKCANYDPDSGSSHCLISANDIKKYRESWTGIANQFEPRLLAYISSSDKRPPIFLKYGLQILPIQNGLYMLTKHNIYKDLVYQSDYIQEPQIVPRDQTSLILKMGKSESSMIDALRYSGVFERPEILGERITHGSLLNSRHYCTFDMTLNGEAVHVKGVQYEVDACYESATKCLLIEAKSTKTPLSSFNIRQLYFPFRAIHKHIGTQKEIIPIFIHQLNDNIHIWKYEFGNDEGVSEMLAIRQTGYYKFKLTDA